jgi:hypothetical protein
MNIIPTRTQPFCIEPQIEYHVQGRDAHSELQVVCAANAPAGRASSPDDPPAIAIVMHRRSALAIDAGVGCANADRACAIALSTATVQVAKAMAAETGH